MTKEKEAAAIIPARYASQRFPGKPLALIAGKPMIQHVWERCQGAASLDRIIIATDDDRIAKCALAFGAEVAWTRADHPSGTDRLGEVLEANPDLCSIINVQGDEPVVSAELIDGLVSSLSAGQAEMVTAANPIRDSADYENPNVVKVVLDAEGYALYFSRSPLPYWREERVAHEPIAYRHHGIYGYRADLLRKFISWPPGRLEKIERLEQLRALEKGVRIAVMVTEEASLGVDDPGDVARAEEALRLRGLI